MKKQAAIFMAAFYLLLTTGMYVCVVSCGSSHLREFLAANVSSVSHSHDEKQNHCQDESKKDCDGNEDCSCCKKHGDYIVKENIKPDSTFQLLEIPVVAERTRYLVFCDDYSSVTTTNEWPKIHAPPPPGISAPIFIKLHSLLI